MENKNRRTNSGLTVNEYKMDKQSVVRNIPIMTHEILKR